MPVKRIFSVLLRFDLALLLYVVIALLINNGSYPYTLKHTLLALIGLESIGNSNWYIFAILVAYSCTYVAFMLSAGNRKAGICITLVLLLTYCFTMKSMHYAWIWYDTILCYPLGMLLSLYRHQFEKVTKKSVCRYLIIVVCMLLQLASYKYGNSFLIRELAILSFTVLIVTLTQKLEVGNFILLWFGKHLFSIYILQRIPMILLKHYGLSDLSSLLFFFASLAGTLLLVKPFEYCSGKAWRAITSPKGGL